MRLWHKDLICDLPNQQLLGQHRECCALRGNGWGRKHATVNYVFNYPYEYLYSYHLKVIEEMNKRGYKVDNNWINFNYRGKNCLEKIEKINRYYLNKPYMEHDNNYLMECIENLTIKGTKPINDSKWEIEKYLLKK